MDAKPAANLHVGVCRADVTWTRALSDANAAPEVTSGSPRGREHDAVDANAAAEITSRIPTWAWTRSCRTPTQLRKSRAGSPRGCRARGTAVDASGNDRNSRRKACPKQTQLQKFAKRGLAHKRNARRNASSGSPRGRGREELSDANAAAEVTSRTPRWAEGEELSDADAAAEITSRIPTWALSARAWRRRERGQTQLTPRGLCRRPQRFGGKRKSSSPERRLVERPQLA
jgi:hypothetical protein